ncbi:MAG: hypothetical protein QM642_09785 [Edaphocola sp.]
MKYLILLIMACGLVINSNAQDYPIDKRTNKICYTDTVTINAAKEQLFKRAEQFIVSQNFDRVENIRCKNKSHVAVQIVNKPIAYRDYDEGKYIGNGFVNFECRGKERFVIIFKLKLGVKNNLYKYEFTDFQVWEFVSAPKNKSKSRSSAYGGAAGSGVLGVGSSSGFTVFSADDVRKWDLEDFAEEGAYGRRGSDEVFQERIKRLIGDLKTAMQDDF